jgi:argininosuccinate synthase
MTRDEEKEYAQKLGIKPRSVGERVYSIDRNLWGLAIEGEDLEDTWSTPPEDAYSWTRPISKTPDSPIDIEIGFSQGTPVSLDGEELRSVALVDQLNNLAGEHGVGRIDHLENRLVGIKSREVYEMPAATVLHAALRGLETVVLARDQQRLKSMLAQHYADLVYDGRWYTALRENLDAFMVSALKFATGDVRVRLWKGTAKVTGRRSPHSLYSYDLATYSTQDKFDHQAALGFIDIYSLPARTQAAAQRDNSESSNNKL